MRYEIDIQVMDMVLLIQGIYSVSGVVTTGLQ